MRSLLKGIGTVLALLILLGVSSPILAENMGKTAESNGLNVVICLDSSNSLNKDNKTGSDEGYYRLDAANIMINMCSIGNSYIAVVPFDQNPWNKGEWLKMHQVTEKNREMLGNAIMTNRNVGAGTNIFSAIEKARKAPIPCPPCWGASLKAPAIMSGPSSSPART